MHHRLKTILYSGLVLIAGAGFAHADTFTFTFNSLGSGVTDSGIQTYMNGVLSAAGSAATVKVTGAAVTDQTYNGDGHVVGPCNPVGCGSGATVSSLTLGTDSGSGYDTFVKNQSGSDPTSFTFTFTGLTVTSVSFDWEIFPDGTCTKLDGAGSACGGAGDPNDPDMTFQTNLGQVFHYYAGTPASPGYTHSPASGRTGTELTPQAIGHFTSTTPGTVNVTGANTLTFIDWPATIAIDNLVITTVPEPSAVVLLGTVMAGLLWAWKRRKQTA